MYCFALSYLTDSCVNQPSPPADNADGGEDEDEEDGGDDDASDDASGQ
jgi:hypothetical protein